MIITQEMFVQLSPYTRAKPQIFDMDMAGHNSGYIHICKVDVSAEFDMPSDLDIRDAKIKKLNKHIEKEKAASALKVERLEIEKQKLLAITA